MIKKAITYTDYDGNVRTETFYFNLNKAEVSEMEFSTDGGLSKQIQAIFDFQDKKRLIEIFKEIILKAYGKKSVDGRRFEKSKELSTEFSQTEAYSELFMELATNADSAAAFVNGIMPAMPQSPSNN